MSFYLYRRSARRIYEGELSAMQVEVWMGQGEMTLLHALKTAIPPAPFKLAAPHPIQTLGLRAKATCRRRMAYCNFEYMGHHREITYAQRAKCGSHVATLMSNTVESYHQRKEKLT